MSAQWLPILASPKNTNKHLGRKGQMTFSAESFDKFVASAQIQLQAWPRIIPDSAHFRAAVEVVFPGFWLRASKIGAEFATRLVMAAGKAAETGAAVRIHAGEVFIYEAQRLGFVKRNNHHYQAECARARQFAIRRGSGSSASRIIKNAISILGLDSHCSVGIYADQCSTQIVLVPAHADICLSRVYATGCSGSFYLAGIEADSKQNHVSEYMATVPTGRFISSASKDAIVKLIESRCPHAGYRAILKEAVLTGLSSDFRSNYSKETQTPRIFATGQSMQFMPSWLRNALFPNWFEMDFSNMHLSILNKEANLGLDLRNSIWNQILDTWQPYIDAASEALGREQMLLTAGIKHLFCGPMNSGSTKNYFFDASKIDRASIKKALKTSLYSLQFGMSAPAARRGFTGDLLEMGLSRAEATFLGNLWSEDKLLNKISAGISEYCKKNSLGPSELAIRCQNIETDLVHEIYKIANTFKRSDICVTLHSHDGVSIWARKPSLGARFFKKCRASCASKLKKLGIQSKLETKGLDPIIKTKSSHKVCLLVVTVCTDLQITRDVVARATGPPV